MIPGLPAGCTASTVLWLPFRRGELTDRGPGGLATSATVKPSLVSGPYGDALSWASGTSAIIVADDASTAFAGGFSVSYWASPDDGATIQNRATIGRMAETGGEVDAWLIEQSATDVIFRVWDSGATLDTLQLSTNSAARAHSTAARWTHVRCAFVPSTGLYLYLDGALCAYKTTALANVASTSLGRIQVGGCIGTTVLYSGAYAGAWRGGLAGVQILSAADTAIRSLDPRIEPAQLTRRNLVAVDLDLPERVDALSFTDDTAGGYWVAWSALTHSGLILDADDVVGVDATTSDTTTTYTAVGNVTDLDAGSSVYFVDAINARLYVSENPAAVDVLRVTVRTRVGTRSMVLGRHYLPVVASVELGERRMAYWDENYPTGGGGTLTIAAQHASLPAGWRDEGGRILWPGSSVRARLLSDHVALGDALTVTRAIVEEHPDNERDTLSLRFVHESALMHRLPVQRSTVTRETYPLCAQKDDGYEFPMIYGRGHLRVYAAAIIDAAEERDWMKLKITDHALARIIAIFIDGQRVPTYDQFGLQILRNVNLDEATFEFYTISGVGEFTVDCDGYADSTDGTFAAPDFPCGTVTDCLTTPAEHGQSWLSRYLGYASTRFGSTWAATVARVQMRRRVMSPLSDAGAFVANLRNWLRDTMTFLYWSASGLIEWEDVVKADGVDWTVRDSDIVAEDFIYDRSHLAHTATAEAFQWRTYPKQPWRVERGVTVAYTSTARAKYGVRTSWEPPGITGIPTSSQLTTWFAANATHFQSPAVQWAATLSARLASVEQMDVLDVQSSARPTGLGSRYRVLSVTPSADSTVRVVAFNEDNFPADGTSIIGYREALRPLRRASWYYAGGLTLSTAGAWTMVPGARWIFSGNFGSQPLTNEAMTVYAQRVGGTGDTDVQFRIREINPTGQTIASIGSVSTTLNNKQSTSFANFPPTAEAYYELQCYLSGGATCRIDAFLWDAEETDFNLINSDLGSTLHYMSGHDPYAECASPAASWTAVPNLRGGVFNTSFIPAGTRGKWAVYADGTGTSGFQLAFRTVPNTRWHTAATLASWSIPTSAGYKTADSVVRSNIFIQPMRLEYKITSGTGKVYVAGLSFRPGTQVY